MMTTQKYICAQDFRSDNHHGSPASGGRSGRFFVSRVIMDTKICFKCKEEKGIDDFYKHPQMADGHLGKCKECTKRDVHDNYSDNRRHYAIYEQLRFKNSERKKKIKEYQRNRRSRETDKYHAHIAFGNAVRDGRIQRQPCNVCGKVKTEGHHPDYSKPLDVIWLCRKHHLELHNKKAYEF